MEFLQDLFIELIVLYVRLFQFFFISCQHKGVSPVAAKRLTTKCMGTVTTPDFLLRFLILNDFDICSEIIWINPHYVPNKRNFLCLEIRFVLFTSKNSLATGDRAGLIRWTPFIKLRNSFLHVACERKKERNLPTIQEGPGYITRKRAVHPRMEKSHSGWAPTE